MEGVDRGSKMGSYFKPGKDFGWAKVIGQGSYKVGLEFVFWV